VLAEGQVNNSLDYLKLNSSLVLQPTQSMMAYKKLDGRPSGLVQQGYLHPARIGYGQKKSKPFREIIVTDTSGH